VEVSVSAVPGEIRMYAGASAPAGWLICDGAQILIASYPALAAALGTTYGGNGTTHIALPDLRGRLPMGAGAAHALGATGGAESATLTASQVPLAAHTHTASFAPGSDVSVNIAIPAVSGANGTTNTPGTGANLGQATVDLSIAGGGSTDPVNTYSTATANTTLKPFPVSVPAGSGTVTVSANTATSADPISILNPFCALNFIIAC
jgi:microcystin-dependent protein